MPSIHNPAVALLPQTGQGCLGGVQCALHAPFELRRELVPGDGIDSRPGVSVEREARQRIVHDGRDRAAEGGACGRKHRIHLARVRHVGADRPGPVGADLSGQGLGCGTAVPVIDHQPGLLAGEGAGNGTPETTAGASNEHQLLT